MGIQGEKKSGYTVPYSKKYDGKWYEIDTTATSGFPQKPDAKARVSFMRRGGWLARLQPFSRKVDGKTVVRYHVYIRVPRKNLKRTSK